MSCDGVHAALVSFLCVSAISYVALRKLAFYHPLKIASYTLQFNVFRLMFKGLMFRVICLRKGTKEKEARARTKDG